MIIKNIFRPKTIFFLILSVILLLLVPKLKGLMLLLFAAFIIAAALNPVVNNFDKKIKNRSLSASVVVFTTISALCALFLPLLIMCYKDIMLFITIMPQKAAALYKFLTHTKLYGKSLSQIIPSDNIVNFSTDLAQNIFNQSLNITLTVAQLLIIGLALMMFVFYILVDKSYLREKFIEFFPPYLKDKAGNILSNITSRVGNYVRAQALSMVMVGIMIAIMVGLLGIDYPIMLGLIAGICEIIPVLGPTVAVSIIAIIALPLGSAKVVLAIILFLAIQQTSNYVIRPFLFGRFMKLHPISILVALFVAQEFLGLPGIILSPAIAATVCVLVDELYLIPMNAKEPEKESEEND